MVPIIVLLVLVALVALDFVVLAVAQRRLSVAAPAGAHATVSAFTPEDALPPAGLFVSPGNTWLRLRPNGTVRIGGTALAMGALGRPNAVHLPAAGSRIHKGDPLFSLQMTGRQATFRSPLETIAEHAFNDWAVEIRPDDLAAAVAALPVADRAAAWTRREYDRLKDIVVALTAPPGMEAPALADGGALTENALSHLRPEAWKVAVDALLAMEDDRSLTSAATERGAVQ